MNLYCITDEARDKFFVRITPADPVDPAADAAAAQSSYEAWRDVPNIENPSGRAVIDVQLVASDDAELASGPHPNYID